MAAKREKMTEAQEWRITKNYTYIQEHLEAKDIFGYFIEKGILSLEKVDEILAFNPNTREHRNRKFLEFLVASAPESFDVFLDALDRTGYDFIADRIRSTERSQCDSENKIKRPQKPLTENTSSAMPFLKGKSMEFVKQVGHEVIHWKQGSFFGIGGDRAQSYNVCQYDIANVGKVIVYVQTGWEPPRSLNVDSKLQFGVGKGVFFMVYHDKEQTPYQNRFMMNPKQEWLNVNLNGISDVSWLVGNYLQTF